MKAWNRLKDIFQDNKYSRAVYLEQQFSNTQLDNFPNVSAYCQELKMLADQLSNVGAPVTNQRLVLQLIVGLNESYDGVATIIQHTDPLPPFYEARSKLILKETRKSKQAITVAITAGTALITTTTSNNNTKQVATGTHDNTRASHGNGTSNGRGRGGCTGGRGRGNGGGRGRGHG
nr:retrovirus-related Pol polyprotein from transposon TNT 1-94 [Tanacetum cinerariifolium]